MTALTNPDPAIAWQVLLTIGVLLAISVNLLNIWRTSRVQKREVTFGESMVSKEFCEMIHQRTEERFRRIEAEVAVIRAEMKADRDVTAATIRQEVGKVHDRVNSVLEAVSELRGVVTRKV